MIKIVSSFTNLRYNAVAINPIWEDLNTISAPVTPLSTSATTNRLQNSIKINELKYTYPGSDKPSIKDINLSIPKAGSISLVGPTGSGKTTLADLLLGLLKPDEGAILENGFDINNNLTEWHRKIGYIPQFIYLLNDTIKNNIAFGLEDSEIDEKKLQNAVSTAQLENFVLSLPEGVETIVGERGIRLSGGQRQRIGIARALYNNPEILVMDEATSALDNTTEDLLVQALEKLKEDHTIIMIAHRLSTIKNCDTLYFMKDGHIIASGNYEELLSKCDEFRKMAK
jgi:ATP-binding cassette subfamily C protein